MLDFHGRPKSPLKKITNSSQLNYKNHLLTTFVKELQMNITMICCKEKTGDSHYIFLLVFGFGPMIYHFQTETCFLNRVTSFRV
jgi:hypothetical protein